MTKSQTATLFATIAVIVLVVFVLLTRFLEWVFKGSPVGVWAVPIVFFSIWAFTYVVEWITEARRETDERS